MSKPIFGQLIDLDLPHLERDAVHIPIVKVWAQNPIYPGDWLALRVSGDQVLAYRHNDESRETPYAKVDPFLKQLIKPGEAFYAWLRPESTYQLWHQWTHKTLDK